MSERQISAAAIPPEFDAVFRSQLQELFRWRRDVRAFQPDPLPEGAVARLVEAACLGPSVGLSEPWRFVLVDDLARRSAVRSLFEHTNVEAAAGYDDDTAAEYRRLKLAGLEEAPVQLAVFVDDLTDKGRGLGRQTMPESVAYSVVTAIQNLWLAAAAEGIGVGWVSILQPDDINPILDVPVDWRLIAYLCIGYPAGPSARPLLEEAGWEERRSKPPLIER